jgi:hypothetical protein
MPTTHTLTCVYKLTAVGAVPVATLASRFAAVPVDLALPNMVGLLYEADSTVTVGQDATRTIVLQARPTVDATATATLFPGDVSGSKVRQLLLGLSGSDYATPPIVRIPGVSDNVEATARASMGVGRGIIINSGSGYVAPSIAFLGGMLAPGGTQASATIAQVAGVLQPPVIVTPGGPYNVPPVAVVTDAGPGVGGIVSPSLKVTGLTLLQPGAGYSAVGPVTITPFFSSCCPDSQPDSQKSFLRSWMTAIFRQELTLPVYALDPTIA